ncbi:MAG: GNAT family N-acetyltransferase [Methylovulum sp.]|uniref:GNAT family N-acetyltransferase n=1 Tax=Methylovulum sp. TaxID=1916980 RepID=UPI0026074256|nr:GNAT family N-acetyltransferase [Methylovulum sp.]MDD2722696.1 GNAT family N-acetyltransferase [Methylovulum sp.]MDD5124235.1 GNAT family N-acetyltransferase [Methylovulum sp.]
MISDYFSRIDDSKEFTYPLRDGELVDFRPVRPDDKEIIQKGMLALSTESRYFRFFSPILKLSDAQLHNFTEIDQHHHVAWIALADNGPGHQGVGIARFIRIENQPTVAEFGMVVIDSYQHRGVGTILLAVLDRIASIKGIEILRGFVLTENLVMGSWLGRLGAVGVYENDHYRMDLTVRGGLFPLTDW